MAEDIFSSNWRESQKTKETYSYLADITDEQLKTLVQQHYDTKSKDIIEYEKYFFYPIQFEDRDTKKPVQMIYRFNNKKRPLTKDGQQQRRWCQQTIRTQKGVLPNI